MIEAEHLTVRLGGKTVVDAVDLVARDGEVLGIVGPNGSGKSTLLRALMGVQQAAGGHVRIDGTDIAHATRRWIARRVSFVGQMLDPDPTLRVGEEVALGAIARQGSWRAQSRRTEASALTALRTVGLDDRAADVTANLSGGERQRVAIARSILHGADHALLDEPTNHLDIRHRLELIALLRTIAPTVVVVLHDLELAARCCDAVVLLDAGRVVASGAPAQVLAPTHLDAVYDVRTHVLPTPAGSLHLSFDLPSSL